MVANRTEEGDADVRVAIFPCGIQCGGAEAAETWLQSQTIQGSPGAQVLTLLPSRCGFSSHCRNLPGVTMKTLAQWLALAANDDDGESVELNDRSARRRVATAAERQEALAKVSSLSLRSAYIG